MKKAIIEVERYDQYDNEDYTTKHEVMLNADDMERLTNFTTENLIAYLRENCVGKNTTVCGDDTYFIPRIKISTLEFSIQNNYYVWRLRENLVYEMYKDASFKEWEKIREMMHKTFITDEEFDATIDGYLDVLIVNDGARLFMGQMYVSDIAYFMRHLAIDLSGELSDY